MPKLKRSPIEEKIYVSGKLIENKANLKDISNESMAKTMGRTVRTVQQRRRDPGNYTLRELAALSVRMGGLGIEL